jgi:hypothetical protein
MTDVECVESLEVTRWRRYGKDRLYVTTADGRQIGWWDLETETANPETESDAEALELAVRDWRSRLDRPATVAETEPVQAEKPAPEPGSVTESTDEPRAAISEPERPWLDLSTNAAGAEARAQAVALRDAAPVRTLAARVFGLHTDERAWRIGADGEEKVAAQLRKLLAKDPRWQVIHAIQVGTRGSDIDHLVIGPGGIFTINTKNHPDAKIWVGGDTFMVNGNRQPYIRNARHEAGRAAKLLTEACGQSVHVEGLIAVVNAVEVTIKSPSKDVTVVPRRQIATWLLRHGDVLAESERALIFDIARRSTTWR